MLSPSLYSILLPVIKIQEQQIIYIHIKQTSVARSNIMFPNLLNLHEKESINSIYIAEDAIPSFNLSIDFKTNNILEEKG